MAAAAISAIVISFGSFLAPGERDLAAILAHLVRDPAVNPHRADGNAKLFGRGASMTIILAAASVS